MFPSSDINKWILFERFDLSGISQWPEFCKASQRIQLTSVIIHTLMKTDNRCREFQNDQIGTNLVEKFVEILLGRDQAQNIQYCPIYTEKPHRFGIENMVGKWRLFSAGFIHLIWTGPNVPFFRKFISIRIILIINVPIKWHQQMNPF